MALKPFNISGSRSSESARPDYTEDRRSKRLFSVVSQKLSKITSIVPRHAETAVGCLGEGIFGLIEQRIPGEGPWMKYTGGGSVVDSAASNPDPCVQSALRGTVLVNLVLYEWSRRTTIFDDLQGRGNYVTDFQMARGPEITGFFDSLYVKTFAVNTDNAFFTSLLRAWREVNGDVNKYW